MNPPTLIGRPLVRCLATLLLAGLAASPLSAGDWPQILGPNRNGIATGEQLLGQVPDDGLKILWQYEVGEGYAGPAVQASRVVIYHRLRTKELADCLDLNTGERIWRTELPAEYQPGINPDAGPRCVPIISDGRVYTFSPGGRLTCLKFADGEIVWDRQLFTDYRGDENYFGAGSTPLILGGQILLNVGGKPDAGLVAVDAKTGETKWTATKEGTSYAAPISLPFEGKTIALFITRLNTVGIDPEGKVLFEYPFGMRGATVNAAIPLLTKEGVFLSSSYGVGARMIKPAIPNPQVVWSNTDSLSSQYFTSVYYEGHLYGIDGREDFQNTSLRCVSAATGKVVWTKEGVPGAHLILVGDQILMVDIEGGVRAFAATPSGYRATFETKLLDTPGRSLPALSQGLLLVRSNAQRGTGVLKCAVVGRRPE